MNHFIDEKQIEELVEFDYVEEDSQFDDLTDLVEENSNFNINDYLNSNIDY